MSEQNPYHGNGLPTMERVGLTPEELAVSRAETMSFEEKAKKLELGAAEIIAKYPKYVTAIKNFFHLNGGAMRLTEESCELFLRKNPDFPYEEAMVAAIAKSLYKKQPEEARH